MTDILTIGILCQPHKGVEVFDKILINIRTSKCGLKSISERSDEQDLQLAYVSYVICDY